MKNALQQGQVVPLMEAFTLYRARAITKEVLPILFALVDVMSVVIGVT